MEQRTDRLELDEARGVIEALADEFDGELVTDYSGRYMYGATCYGIVLDGEEVAHLVDEAEDRNLSGHKLDNMALQYIVYWPNVEGKADG